MPPFSRSKSKQKKKIKGRSRRKSDFLLGLLFNSEGRIDTFFRNVGLSSYYRVLQRRKSYTSYLPLPKP
jgi:hypothetical protein